MEASNTFTYTMEDTTFDKELTQTPNILGDPLRNCKTTEVRQYCCHNLSLFSTHHLIEIKPVSGR